MKAIARSTVRDLGTLFINGGFMITVNPCTDHGADETCQLVVDRAKSLVHDGLIAIERMQQRGSIAIDRPHVHWLIQMSKEKVEKIAAEFKAMGLDVKVTPIWGPDGLCFYVGKDPHGKFYMIKQDDQYDSGTPPSAAMKQQREVVPVDNSLETLPAPMKKTEPLRAFSMLPRLLLNWTDTLTDLMEINATPLARLVRVGMARAP